MRNKIWIVLFFCGASTVNSYSQNIDFEQTLPGVYTRGNAVSGWTIESCSNTQTPAIACTGTSSSWVAGSSEVSVMTTPNAGNLWNGVSPFSIDNVAISTSPFGGSNIFRLQNSTSTNSVGLVTRLRSTFSISNTNSLFYFGFAESWGGWSSYTCCAQPSFKLKIYDRSGNLVPALSFSLTPSGQNCFSSFTFSTTGGVSWSNWTSRVIDLATFIGSCVTVEVINGDCSSGCHHGSVYFDTGLGVWPFYHYDRGVKPIQPVNLVSFCVGSNQARIVATPSFSTYQWYAPGNPPVLVSSLNEGNTQSLTIINPTSSLVYAVYTVSANGYSATRQYTLQNTSVSILGVGTHSANCGNNSNGTATVFATGAFSGSYTCNWYNSFGLITSGQAVSLSPEIYSVGVTALNAVSCGSAIAPVTIGIKQVNVFTINKSYCNTANSVYLAALSSGVNYQWYIGNSPISAALGGTASAYTANTANNNQIWLSYNSNNSCKDSVLFYLSSALPANLFVSNNKLSCPGANKGQIVLSLTPSIGSNSITNSFSASVVGGSLIASTSFPGSATTFSLNNLSANNSFSVDASDCFCNYTSIVQPNVPGLNFNIIPESSSICSGNSAALTVNFCAPNYEPNTYVWSLNLFFVSNNSTLQSAVTRPTAALGSTSTIIFTVVVTPTVLNFPFVRTIAISVVNLVTPTIALVQALCNNAPAFTVFVNPPGGNFINTLQGMMNNITTPSFLNPVTYNVNYLLQYVTCTNSASCSFTIKPLPVLAVLGNTAFCICNTTTLTASGASTYNWSNGAVGPTVFLSLISSTAITVSGTSTVTGCANSKIISIIVNPLPVVSITGNFDICEGASTTLFVHGGGYYYVWVDYANSDSLLVSPASTATYTFIAGDENGCLSSQDVTVNVHSCTGINELTDKITSFKVYPNPVNGLLMIEGDASSTIILYDQPEKNYFNKEIVCRRAEHSFRDLKQ